MRTGKVSTAVLDRSVFRPINLSGNNRAGERAICASVCGTWTGKYDPSPEMLFAGVCSKILAEGAFPEQMTINVTLPEDCPEEVLKELMKKIAGLATEQEIRISGGHTTVSRAVTEPVLAITMWADQAEREFHQKNKEIKVPLIMAGYAGWSGSAVLANANREGLLKRYPAIILDGCLAGQNALDGSEILSAASNYSICDCFAVSEGGVFGALWEMGNRSKSGFEVDLKSIPIRQETIEVCEWYDLNPYQLYSPGAFLIVAPEGEALAETLRGKQIPAEVIGFVHTGKERIIRNGEEVRYLDKPGQDMLMCAARKEI